MKALVGTFNQEKVLVGAFSVIVKTNCETDGSFYTTIKDMYEEFEEPLSGGEERLLPKLERQWSHPNLRPLPGTNTSGRKLPKTPKQPPGIVVGVAGAGAGAATPSRGQDEYFSDWIENERMRRTPLLPGQRSFESDNYSPPRTRDQFSPPR